jgi:hypothetical protein
MLKKGGSQMSEHFTAQSGTELWFAELFSNQLQLLQRTIDFERSGRGGDPQDTAAYVRQIEALRSKILNQRQQLQILVEGV